MRPKPKSGKAKRGPQGERRPKSRRPKQTIFVWLDHDVIVYFNAESTKGQSRINATLRKAVGL